MLNSSNIMATKDLFAANNISTEADKTTTATETTTTDRSVSLVIQRFRQASILLDESHVVTIGETTAFPTPTEEFLLGGSNNKHNVPSLVSSTSLLSSSTGMLVYVSFSKMVTHEKIIQAAKTVLNLPVLTYGSWGDGSSTCSLLKLARQRQQQRQQQQQYQGEEKQLQEQQRDDQTNQRQDIHKGTLGLLIVPQANLFSKVKNHGKGIRYDMQVEKELGREYYEYFISTLRQLLIQHQLAGQNQSQPTNNNGGNHAKIQLKVKPVTPEPSIAPDQLFRNDEEYGSWDDEGFPLTTANGDPLAKSAKKKLIKIWESHKRRHAKYVSEERTEKEEDQHCQDPQQEQEEVVVAELDPSFCTFVAGSFGKRQGLEIRSDMGPFCHVIEI